MKYKSLFTVILFQRIFLFQRILMFLLISIIIVMIFFGYFRPYREGLDSSGNPVDASGNRVDMFGNPLDPSGNILDTCGNILCLKGIADILVDTTMPSNTERMNRILHKYGIVPLKLLDGRMIYSMNEIPAQLPSILKDNFSKMLECNVSNNTRCIYHTDISAIDKILGSKQISNEDDATNTILSLANQCNIQIFPPPDPVIAYCKKITDIMDDKTMFTYMAKYNKIQSTIGKTPSGNPAVDTLLKRNVKNETDAMDAVHSLRVQCAYEISTKQNEYASNTSSIISAAVATKQGVANAVNSQTIPVAPVTSALPAVTYPGV